VAIAAGAGKRNSAIIAAKTNLIPECMSVLILIRR
jgi:hypothetical protein